MVQIRVKKDESISHALNRFRKKCEKAGIRKEIKKRLRYEKPSARRRRKMRDIKRKQQKRRKRRRR